MCTAISEASDLTSAAKKERHCSASSTEDGWSELVVATISCSEASVKVAWRLKSGQEPTANSEMRFPYIDCRGAGTWRYVFQSGFLV